MCIMGVGSDSQAELQVFFFNVTGHSLIGDSDVITPPFHLFLSENTLYEQNIQGMLYIVEMLNDRPPDVSV